MEKGKVERIEDMEYMGEKKPKYYLELIHDGIKYLGTTIHYDWKDVPIWSEDNVAEMIGKPARWMMEKTSQESSIAHYHRCIFVDPKTATFIRFSPEHDAVYLANGCRGHAKYFSMTTITFFTKEGVVLGEFILPYTHGMRHFERCEIANRNLITGWHHYGMPSSPTSKGNKTGMLRDGSRFVEIDYETGRVVREFDQ